MIRDYFQKMVEEIEMENANEIARAEAITAAGQWRGRSRRGTAWAR